MSVMAQLNQFHSFHQSSLPNGKIDWEWIEIEEQWAPQRHMNWWNQFNKAREKESGVWACFLFGGLWAAEQPMAPPKRESQAKHTPHQPPHKAKTSKSINCGMILGQQLIGLALCGGCVGWFDWLWAEQPPNRNRSIHKFINSFVHSARSIAAGAPCSALLSSSSFSSPLIVFSFLLRKEERQFNSRKKRRRWNGAEPHAHSSTLFFFGAQPKRRKGSWWELRQLALIKIDWLVLLNYWIVCNKVKAMSWLREIMCLMKGLVCLY